jgi:hypothetical protein
MGFYKNSFSFYKKRSNGRLIWIFAFIFTIFTAEIRSAPTMNLGSLWFHHNNVEPWTHKDFPYNNNNNNANNNNNSNNNNNRWYTTTPKVYELEGADDGKTSLFVFVTDISKFQFSYFFIF